MLRKMVCVCVCWRWWGWDDQIVTRRTCVHVCVCVLSLRWNERQFDKHVHLHASTSGGRQSGRENERQTTKQSTALWHSGFTWLTQQQQQQQNVINKYTGTLVSSQWANKVCWQQQGQGQRARLDCVGHWIIDIARKHTHRHVENKDNQ